MQILLDVILPVFLLIGFGYVAVWRDWFPLSGIDGVMKFSQNIAIPCLLFQAVSKIDLKAAIDPALLGSFYAGALICFALGTVGARTLFKRDWEDCVAIGFCCLFSNSILLGLPITERAFGADALDGNIAILSVHAPFCYGLGITVMEFVRHRGQGGKQVLTSVAKAMFRNALILGIGLGFLVNISGAGLPFVLDEALSLIARAALPAALFALGGVLIQYKPEGDLKAVGMVCVIALVVHPGLVWAFGTASGLQQDGFRSAVLTAAMAPGFNAYIFANMYGRAKRIAATSVLVATGSAIVTVWVWISLLG